MLIDLLAGFVFQEDGPSNEKSADLTLSLPDSASISASDAHPGESVVEVDADASENEEAVISNAVDTSVPANTQGLNTFTSAPLYIDGAAFNDDSVAQEFSMLGDQLGAQVSIGPNDNVSIGTSEINPASNWEGATDYMTTAGSGVMPAVAVGSSDNAFTANFQAAPVNVFDPSPSRDDAPRTITIVDGVTVEISGTSDQSVTFIGTSGKLKLDQSTKYTGQISGLAGSDALDLVDVNYGANTQETFLGNVNGGVLTVSDGVSTASITLEGNYLASTWDLSSDGNGGTIVVDPVSPNDWQSIVGAGGFVSGIDVAPDGNMVARTDTYGAYIWNGTEWQQLLTSTSMPSRFVAPNSNTEGVYEIQVAPSNSSILYMMYEGYVFKSSNDGATWLQTSFAQVSASPNDAYRGDGQKMAIDPDNPNTVYVGTPENGLFVTTDGGATWQSVSAVPVSNADSSHVYPGITGIEFDPALGVTGGRTNTIFSASYGNGVYQSTNGGASWALLSGGPTDVAYAAVSSTGVYYAAQDNGTTSSLWSYSNGRWTQLYSNISGWVQSVAVNPSDPSEIVIQSIGGSIDVSYDAGATWSGFNSTNQLIATDVPWLATTDQQFMSVGGSVFDPTDPNELIATAGVGVWTTSVPTADFSTSAPLVWTSQSIGINQLVANEIIVPPGGDPVFASWDRPFFYINNLNEYTSSYAPNTGGTLAQGWAVDYASSNPAFLVGIADWYGIEELGYSTNGGQTWNMFPSFPSIVGEYVNGTLTGQQQFGGTIAASTPENIIWSPSGGVDPYYTLDGGQTWNPITLPGVSSWSGFDWAYYLDEHVIAADRVLANTFYLFYADIGVFKTTNGGQSWTEVYSGGLSPSDYYNALLESVPGEAGNLFFTGGPQAASIANAPANEPFMRSTDGGATWTAVANVLDVNCFGFGAAAPGQGYPSIYIVGWVNNAYGVWQSINNAQSWTQIGAYPLNSLDEIKTISGDPNVYGQVYVGFSGSGYAYLPGGPLVSSVSASTPTGTEFPGNTITLTVTMTEVVTVTGTPTLSLNDGGTATYTGGSGTGALTFSYTVSGSDSDVTALAITQANLPNGATITDASGTGANLAGVVTTFTGLQIDPPHPQISSIVETPTGGDLNAGKTVTLTLNLSAAVTVTGGIPTLTLNDGGTATYTGGSGTSALTFSYTVGVGQNTAGLAATAVNLNASSITDGQGDTANLSLTGLTQSGPQIDATTPSVSSVVTSGTGITGGGGVLDVGKTVILTLNLNEAVTVSGGTPTLTLNDGGTATYTSGSGTSTLTFAYTVAAGQNTPDLTVTAVNLNAATAADGAGNIADLTGAVINPAGVLQIETTPPTVLSVVASGLGITSGTGDLNTGKVVTLTLNLSAAVTVAGGTPTLTLSDGGIATYTGGSGTGALTFSYTVAAGQNTSELGVTAVNANAATITDGAGNAANLSGAVTNPAGTLQIDTTVPTVTSLVMSPSGGDLGIGDTVTITFNLSEAVTVAGGTPTLVLNDGGIATYTGGSGTSALTFSYTVGAGQNNAHLTVSNVISNGATFTDGAGNAANMAPPGAPGPQIDTTAPAAPVIATDTINGNNSVSLSGTAEANSTVTVYDGGTSLGTAAANGSGNWSFNTGTLASGAQIITATSTDAAGNTSSASNAVAPVIPQSNGPVVSLVVASGTGLTAGSGDLNAGKVVTLTLNLSEAVTVAGGTPTLTLNDGGLATYASGSGTNALTFSYTVGAGQNTADLAITAVNANAATITDGAGNAANLIGAVTNPAGTLQIDTTTPTVSSVVASGTGIASGTGDLNAGRVVTLTLNMSEAVTVSGGTPTLTLNDGGVATYTGGSGTSTLTFSYTVAAGQNTSDLTVTAVNANAATITDGAGNAANLGGAVTNPAGTLQIDTTTPTVSSVVASGTGIASGTGDLNAGKVVTLTLNMSEAVTVSGGTPTLALNDGGTATYTGGSGTSALTFSYTVAAGQTTSDLAITAVNANAATIADGAGNAANLSGAVTNPSGTLQVDTTAPTVVGISETPSNGDLNAGKVVTLTISMSEAVTVAGGTPTLTLNDGGVATYTGGSGTSALTFSYTVAAGQNTPDLMTTAVNLNAATITDGAGNAANLSLVGLAQGSPQIDTTTPTVSSVVVSGTGIANGNGDLTAGNVVTLTLNLSEAVTVGGGTPTLTLNDGGVATYTGGSGTNTLTFNYTIAAGQTTSDLAITAVNANAATVTDGAGNAANLSGAVTNPPGTLQIDTTTPTVSSVVATGAGITAGSGDLDAGKVATLTLNLSEAVTVAGGTPTLTLNDGGVATYTGGSGTSALTFSYTVGAGQNTSDLTVTAVNTNAATITDGAGNVANLGGAVTNPAGTLQIDTTVPTVSSVVASGTGITSGTGDLNVGKVVTLTLNMSEAATVSGGTPTLTLNDGGVATYTGGSGTSALTFNYTVAAGQNTSDLAISAVNTNAASITDGAGNAANLAGAVTNPAGILQIGTALPTVSSVVTSGTGITSGNGDLNTGDVVTLTVNLSEAVTVAGGTPTLTLNDGGVATYTGGSGTSALTFSYTVGASQNTSDLGISAVNTNAATIVDGAGNAANLIGAVTNPAGTLQIDTTAPTVSSVVTTGTGITSGAGDLNAGKVVTLTLNMSEAVTVSGGTPTLTLNDGGVATYAGGSGTSALTFSYTVGAGQNTSDLAVTAVNANAATITDGAGNAANLSGAVTNPAGTLQIDTTTPTVSSVVASGTGITSGSGDLDAGKTVTLTLNHERGCDGLRRHADADAQ